MGIVQKFNFNVFTIMAKLTLFCLVWVALTATTIQLIESTSQDANEFNGSNHPSNVKFHKVGAVIKALYECKEYPESCYSDSECCSNYCQSCIDCEEGTPGGFCTHSHKI